MKEKKIERLTKKYKEGASTLQEEQFLFDNSENSPSIIDAWTAFIKQNKIKVPENLNDRLWDSFQNRTARKRRLKIKTIAAAASVFFIIAFFIGNREQKLLSYREKEVLLKEALNMFAHSEQEIARESIIYEDEQIIIYTHLE